MNRRIIKFLLTCLLSVILSFSIFSVACNLVATDTYYTVIFDSDGGSSVKQQSVKSGDTAAEPAAPSREGYDFDGWYLGGELYDFDTAVTDNITLKANWSEKSDIPPVTKYTVTFDSNGGSAVNSAEAESGKTATKPADPTREGYTFVGWFIADTEYNFDTPVTDNITLAAKWTENSVTPPPPVTKYTVTFDSNGGSAVNSAEAESGTTVAKPADPTREGYTFDGWFISNEEYNFGTPVTGNITLTAKWTEVIPPVTYYTVTFYSDGGSSVSAQYVESGKTATEPENPTKNGYIFAGWYYGSTEYNFSSEITADITLSAHWDADTSTKYYTVSFVTNCESTVIAQEVASGGKAVKPAAPLNAGYVLENWYTDSGFNNIYSFDTAVTADITLYAKWVDDTSAGYFEVSFNTNGGSSVSAQEVLSGRTATEPSAPVKENYTFAGWFTEAEFENEYNFNSAVTKNITLYAKWNENTTPEYKWVTSQADFTNSQLSAYKDSKSKTDKEITIGRFVVGTGVYCENKDAGLKIAYGDINTQSISKALSFSLNGSENSISFVAKGASSGTLQLCKVNEDGSVTVIKSWACASDIITVAFGELELEAGNYYIGSIDGSVRLGSLIIHEYVET